MALPRFLNATFVLVLSLFVIVSATDYGYGTPKSQYETPKPQENYNPSPQTPDYYQKPKSEGNDKPYSYTPKPNNYEKPTPEGKDKPYSYTPKASYENKTYPDVKEKLIPTIIGIQGLVLCKSGSTYFPLQGAVARITCVGVDEKGNETAPFSILSGGCDAKGYFLATLYGVEGKIIKECKAFLDHSPLDICKIPTDVNHGITGALLGSYRLLKEKNIKLYSVGPFFYTSETQSAVPSTGY